MNSTIKKLLTYIKKYKIQILFSLAISAMSVWLSLYIPIIVANAIDYIVGKNQVDFTTDCSNCNYCSNITMDDKYHKQ